MGPRSHLSSPPLNIPHPSFEKIRGQFLSIRVAKKAPHHSTSPSPHSRKFAAIRAPFALKKAPPTPLIHKNSRPVPANSRPQKSPPPLNIPHPSFQNIRGYSLPFAFKKLPSTTVQPLSTTVNHRKLLPIPHLIVSLSDGLPRAPTPQNHKCAAPPYWERRCPHRLRPALPPHPHSPHHPKLLHTPVPSPKHQRCDLSQPWATPREIATRKP
ncbi:hypothetical protein HNQ65_003663 [Prosthecobacter vanneervenii]|uniref:Uncharacterized protein n=1 Tax=Prosthecobacter vanneervenii TaxID=48466 RepID=A0A7W7YD99_9BACT|nr:hypothetical protein [Prosthecobacter vanneervenii]